MSEFDNLFWGFIFSTAGIIIGWVLNELSHWFGQRVEDKKSLKIVIYNLLETYFLFLRCDFERLINLISEEVIKRFPIEHQTEELNKSIRDMYFQMVNTIVRPEIMGKLRIQEEHYEVAVKTLSNIDPLVAFYLTGRTRVIERIDKIEEWFLAFEGRDAISINLGGESGVKYAIELLKPGILGDALEDWKKKYFH